MEYPVSIITGLTVTSLSLEDCKQNDMSHPCSAFPCCHRC